MAILKITNAQKVIEHLNYVDPDTPQTVVKIAETTGVTSHNVATILSTCFSPGTAEAYKPTGWKNISRVKKVSATTSGRMTWHYFPKTRPSQPRPEQTEMCIAEAVVDNHGAAVDAVSSLIAENVTLKHALNDILEIIQKATQGE